MEGARQGAERIAWKIGDFINEEKSTRERKWSESSDSGYGSVEEEGFDMRRVGLGQENQFSLLDVSDED